ncbi:phosphoribosyltransferase [Prochlorothrix hollandica]|uniref:Phosphoribosyltransferase n=1 Tax=Prochlorothrix hollandica PCC 9006 = CALU 1027 TaxID=317619 RepID=A0A0M2PZ42_PROHO|nr:phosphoribosyltransferase family protein [Prochlorothrix hollandica]KKI99666.1 phosphoribosyltransferase [Prochlorothrix hollandica PCC 9006 = CALU 1027]
MTKPDTDLYVSWTDYYSQVETLAVQIYESGWTFNQIVCLAKGGLRIGDILCRLYDCPLAILAAASYGGQHNQERHGLVFSRDLTMTTANLGSHVLVVDDLVDSGITLERSLQWLTSHYGFYIEEMRTGVLWYKSTSVIQPNYYVDFLDNSPWIHQPFESYERITPQQLAQRHQIQKAANSLDCDRPSA